MKNQQPKVYGVVLAGGRSVRFGRDKLQEKIASGDTILDYTLKKMLSSKKISTVILVGGKTRIKNSKLEFIKGGKTRQQSSYLAIEYISKQKNPAATDIVVLHNAANPQFTDDEIKKVIKGATQFGAAIVAHPVIDTIKEVKGGFVSKTIPRDNLYAAQTPQAFKWEIILVAHNESLKKKYLYTDDAALVEALGGKVKVLMASVHNKKITFPEDFNLISQRGAHNYQNFRVGVGQDSHRFETKKRGLVLGGLRFAKEYAFKANSDGDVILHAICNAILSSIGEGSFSFIADPMCKKGIVDSTQYLNEVLIKMKKNKYRINNLALTLQGASPKFEPIIPKIKKNLAKLLSLKIDKIGVTAHSGEKMTPFGDGKGVQCTAVISITNEN